MNIKTILLALTLFTGLPLIQACQSEETAQVPSNHESVTLDMQNMTCAMCGITIKKSLQGVEGVQTVTVDADTETAVVTFDSKKTNTETLIKATTHAGYPATIHQPK